MTELRLPQLSIGMEEGRVSRWLAADGDAVDEGQPVLEVDTDKATVEVVAPVKGALEIIAAVDTLVPVDGLLARIRASTDVSSDPTGNRYSDHGGATFDNAELNAVVSVSSPLPGGNHTRIAASPAARRIAMGTGIHLAEVVGSGPNGRIVARDIQAHIGKDYASASVATTDLSAGQSHRDDEGDALRHAVVKALTLSWQQVPHINIGGELAADGLIAAKACVPVGSIKVTMTDLLIVALAAALAEVPELNALAGSDGIEPCGAVDLALAVATSRGVVAPVIKDVGGMSLSEVALKRQEIVSQARSAVDLGRLPIGGTITLSNLGAYPVDFFTPIISSPQVATVAVGRIRERPIAADGWISVKPTIWANVAVDHRAADGEAGARLLAALERQFSLLGGASR